jgi:hypothetical protein
MPGEGDKLWCINFVLPAATNCHKMVRVNFAPIAVKACLFKTVGLPQTIEQYGTAVLVLL